MPRIIKTTLTTGEATADGDWKPDTKSEWPDDLNVDEYYEIEPYWNAGAIADVTVEALHEMRCDAVYSSLPDWQPHGWYGSNPYTNPYSGLREERTAHLKGFTDEESRLIHSKIFGG